MPIRLQDRQGFPYRFGQYTGCSPFLAEYEHLLGNKAEHLHRARINMKLVRDDILQFKNNSKSLRKDEVYRLALSHVTDLFRLPEKQKLLHFNDLLKYDLKIWNTSPGLPYRTAGYKTKREVIDNKKFVNDIRWMLHRVKVGEEVHFPDCCAYTRSQLGEYGENKVRAVWGYPISMILAEGIFAVPLIEAYSSHTDISPIAYGYETALGGTRSVCRRFAKDKSIFGLDYKRFDKTVPKWLIDSAFYVLEQNLDFLHYRDHGTTHAKGILRLWSHIKKYFVRTPIRMPNGERYLKLSGVASGSYFTQLIDSICNAIIITYICLKRTNSYPRKLLVLGDDSLFACTGLTLDEIAEDLVSEFGMQLNVAKSGHSSCISNLEFLGYSLQNGIPTKPFTKLLASLLYPEYPDDDESDVLARALGLYYANMGVDHRFHNICLRIINVYRNYDLRFSRQMERFVELLGFKAKDIATSRLPNEMEMYLRFIYASA